MVVGCACPVSNLASGGICRVKAGNRFATQSIPQFSQRVPGAVDDHPDVLSHLPQFLLILYQTVKMIMGDWHAANSQPKMMLDLPPGGARTLTLVFTVFCSSPRLIVVLPPTCCTTFLVGSTGGTKLVFLSAKGSTGTPSPNTMEDWLRSTSK